MKKLFFLLILPFTISNVIGQENNYKKVGVVLSGGGAKGLSHISALRVIEKAGIKIDYIGGTSSGSIIGMLYSIGYSLDEIENMMREFVYNHNVYINDIIPREQLSVFNKKINDRYLVSLPIDNFIPIPIGLTEGYMFLSWLNEKTHHVHGIKDFSKLKIPFLCLATNLETGEEVVLKSGNLAESIRASCSYPLFISPIEIDDMVLVDGGISNNLPSREVKNMGADILIAIDVQENLFNKIELDNAYKIVNQIISFKMSEKNEYQRKICDLIIYPDITNTNITSFDQTDMFIRNGRIAAEKKWEELKNIASIQKKSYKGEEINNFNIDKSFPKPFINKKISIKNINIDSDDDDNTNFVKEELNFINSTERKINYSELKKYINEIYSTKKFRYLSYKLLPTKKEDEKDLYIDIRKTKINKYLKLGFNYNSVSRTSLLVNYTDNNFLFKNSNISADFIFDNNFTYYYLPRYLISYNFDIGGGINLDLHSSYQSIFFEKQNILFNKISITNDIIRSRSVNQFDKFKVDKVSNIFSVITNGISFKKSIYYFGSVRLDIDYQVYSNEAKEILISDNDKGKLSNYRKYFFFKERSLNIKLCTEIDTYEDKYFHTNGFKSKASYNLFYNKTQKDDTFFLGGSINLLMSVSKKIDKYIGFYFSANSFNTFYYSKIINTQSNIQTLRMGGMNKIDWAENTSFLGLEFQSYSYPNVIKLDFGLNLDFLKNHQISAEINYALCNYHLYDLFNFNIEDEERKSLNIIGLGISYIYKSLLGPIEISASTSPQNNLEPLMFLNIGLPF
ncbi:patatin-like phospholipase family protein [Ichthyobacterium seriolicida]|uniref:Patatin n=1 Tax=Ichthyobacterium seriolicida TaxID=242600 RepID=A0A1J1E519_9FLAO|nr:patatin-like phospholipase family protein [Ichthyobacterium seriolicida]BAV94406.1 patatin [Ichthyobacterium seriolicida]